MDSRKILGIDIDGTIADSFGEWMKIYSKINPSASIDQVKCYHLEKAFPISRDEYNEIFKQVWDNWETIKIIDKKIPHYISDLAKDYEIRLVTSTDGNLDNVRKWMGSHGIEYSKMAHDMPHRKHMHCDILIDDRLSNVIEFSRNGKEGLLFYTPWCKDDPTDVIPQNINIVHSWEQIYQRLKK